MDPIPRRNLGASEEIVTRLRAADPDDAALRQLRLNLYIEAGEWHGLGDLFKEDLQQAEHRSSRQLLQSEALATASLHPDGKALLHKAAEKAGDDNILAFARDLPTRGLFAVGFILSRNLARRPVQVSHQHDEEIGIACEALFEQPGRALRSLERTIIDPFEMEDLLAHSRILIESLESLPIQ
jgi:hypothetical protein